MAIRSNVSGIINSQEKFADSVVMETMTNKTIVGQHITPPTKLMEKETFP